MANTENKLEILYSAYEQYKESEIAKDHPHVAIGKLEAMIEFMLHGLGGTKNGK